MGPDVRPEGTPDAVLRAAGRSVSGRPDRGHAPQRADRAERRHGPPLHQLQGAGLHRPHLQHEVAVGGSRPAGGRRAARTAGGDPGRALPERLRADRDGRPRTVPAARRRGRRAARPRPAGRGDRSTVRRRAGHDRAERGAVRDLPARGRAPGERRDDRRRRGRPARLPLPAEHRAVRAAERDRAGTARDPRVLGGVLHDVPRIARGRGPVGVRRDHVHRCGPGRDPGESPSRRPPRSGPRTAAIRLVPLASPRTSPSPPGEGCRRARRSPRPPRARCWHRARSARRR